VAGDRILITLSSETLSDSSLSDAHGGNVSTADIVGARTISTAGDHYGTGDLHSYYWFNISSLIAVSYLCADIVIRVI